MSQSGNDIIPVWNIPRLDAGFIYVIKDSNRLKIGKSVTPRTRIQEAKTWLPEMVLVGVKPFWNINTIEKNLHESLAQWWFDKEWFKFNDDTYQEQFIDNFVAFSDQELDRDKKIGRAHAELQSHHDLVCRLLLEKKKNKV